MSKSSIFRDFSSALKRLEEKMKYQDTSNPARQIRLHNTRLVKPLLSVNEIFKFFALNIVGFRACKNARIYMHSCIPYLKI